MDVQTQAIKAAVNGPSQLEMMVLKDSAKRFMISTNSILET